MRNGPATQVSSPPARSSSVSWRSSGGEGRERRDDSRGAVAPLGADRLVPSRRLDRRRPLCEPVCALRVCGDHGERAALELLAAGAVEEIAARERRRRFRRTRAPGRAHASDGRGAPGTRAPPSHAAHRASADAFQACAQTGSPVRSCMHLRREHRPGRAPQQLQAGFATFARTRVEEPLLLPAAAVRACVRRAGSRPRRRGTKG